MYPANRNDAAVGIVSQLCTPALDCGNSAGRFGSRRCRARASRIIESYCAGVNSNARIVEPLILTGLTSRDGPYLPPVYVVGYFFASPLLQNSTPIDAVFHSAA